MTRLITARRTRVCAAGAAVLALALAGCGSADTTATPTATAGGTEAAASAEDGTTLIFWTQHATPQRLAIQEEVAAAFFETTGITVEVVGLDAAGQNQAIVAAAASGDLPDVVLHAPDQTAAWTEQGLLDGAAAQQVVDALGADTFSADALRLVTLDGQLQAVPSDGWGQMLYYRTDLFAAAGLDAPSSLQDIADAAEVLTAGGTTGIVLGTAPGNGYTSQTLETIALANDCQMFTDGQISLDSANCVNALAEYQRMAAASVPGDQDVESSRAAYLAGDAAMVLWSTHFLDELAGLDLNFPVSCEQCADNPQYLAENTGVVSLFTGPDNDDATTFGQTMNLGIMTGAQTEAARQWVEYVLSEAYVQILSTATEGRVPVRTGTADEPQKYVEEWKALTLGADPSLRMPFDEVYSAEVIQTVVDGANGFTRWGLGTADAGVAGTLASQNALSHDLAPLFAGGDPLAVAAAWQATAEAAQRDAGR